MRLEPIWALCESSKLNTLPTLINDSNSLAVNEVLRCQAVGLAGLVHFGRFPTPTPYSTRVSTPTSSSDSYAFAALSAS